jgi:hypothetical protein
MPQRRKGIAGLRRRIVPIKRGRESRHWRGGYMIRTTLRASDPFLKCVQVQYATIAKWLT